MKNMSNTSKSLTALASLSLISIFFLPIWQIDLSAPQYPEGLSMQIWLNNITGQVDIINGLNHYIGMKHINAAMFPEFRFLEYIAAAYILLGLIVALTGKRSLLFAFICLLVTGAGAAMTDFYQWGYDYGHNLDPKAAIQVPGLSYQPPLIGHKQLLNFDAYSFPAIGGYLILATGLMFIAIWWMDWIKNRKKTTGNIKPLVNKRFAAAGLTSLVLLNSCDTKPQPFAYGKDGCDFCKMTIMDPAFGGELITKKGKTYKFDDLHCLIGYLKMGELKKEDLAQTLALDHSKQNKFLNATTALYIVAEALHSPMGSNAVALASAEEASAANKIIKGQIINWQTLYNQTR